MVLEELEIGSVPNYIFELLQKCSRRGSAKVPVRALCVPPREQVDGCPGRPSQLIHPNGKVGDLNIQVAVAGYRCSKHFCGTKTDPTHLQRECVDICRSSISTFPAQPTCSFRGGGGGTS